MSPPTPAHTMHHHHQHSRDPSIDWLGGASALASVAAAEPSQPPQPAAADAATALSPRQPSSPQQQHHHYRSQPYPPPPPLGPSSPPPPPPLPPPQPPLPQQQQQPRRRVTGPVYPSFPARVRGDLRAMLLSARSSLLLLLIPVALASHALSWPGGLTFALCALPLAALAERLGYVTEQLAAYTSDTLGGLLNASFGNATEVIIAAFAIRRRYLRLVKLTLLGSIVSNLLLVLGCAFLAGGAAGHATQRFNRQGAAVNVGLLTLACVAVALPTLLSETQAPSAAAGAGAGASRGGGGSGETAAATTTLPSALPSTTTTSSPELWLSRFESVLMLACYALFLVFQLFTHRHLYEEDGGGDEEEATFVVRNGGSQSHSNGVNPPAPSSSREASFAGFAAAANGKHEYELEMGPLSQQQGHERASLLGGGGGDRAGGFGGAAARGGGGGGGPAGAAAAAAAAATAAAATTSAAAAIPSQAAAAVLQVEDDDDDGDDDSPDMALSSCLAWMALVTLAIALLSDAITSAIAGAAVSLRVPLPFLAAIVLPIVGNAAEHFSAVTFATRNRMEIALGVAVGSSTQVAVLVAPFCVILAWAMGAPLDLDFYAFEALVLFASVALAGAVVQDGTGNWLKGALLLVTYLFVAAGFWVHGDPSLEEEGGVR